jgi:hypothetical protein
MTKADDILLSAIKALSDRAKQRGLDHERSMDMAIAAFNAAIDSNLDTADGYLFMAFLKVARALSGGPIEDDFVDAAAYIALFGESMLNRNDDDDGDDGEGEGDNILHLDFGKDKDGLDQFLDFLAGLNSVKVIH